jgi:PAS domain S-box-containing protein
MEEEMRKLSSAIEQSIDGIAIADLEPKLTYVNDAFAQMHGYSREEMIGMKVVDLHNEKQMDEYQRGMNQIKTQGSWEGEIGHIRKDGTPFATYMSVTLLKGDDGKPRGIATVATDITEHKPTEEARGQPEELYRNMIELSPDGIVAVDAKGIILVYNTAASRMVGYSKDEIVGKHFSKVRIFRVKDTPKYLKIFSFCLRGKTPKPFEMTIYRKDRTTFFAEVSLGLLKAGGKKIIQVTLRDITERKRMEEELIRLSNAVKTSTDSIVISDLEGKMIDVNEATLRMYGTDDKRDLTGKNSLELIAPEEREKALEAMREVLEKGYVKGKEYHIITKDGSQILVEMNSATMKDMDGKPIGFVGISRDITERKRMEQKLKEMQAELIRSEKLAAIGQLAGGVGHELRNPLGAIKNAAYYVKGKVAKSELAHQEPRVIEFLNIMDDEINASNQIINDLLGFSRVGKPSVLPAQIKNVIEDALSHTTIPDNIKLIKKLGAGLPQIEIDASQIQQVLVNMIANAVQAMADGGKLTVAAREKESCLEVEIADTGCGIPEEAAGQIFDPLFTTKAKGIGLGLAVCKTIIDRHEGKIAVKSQAGKGTTFTISLPLKRE